MTTHERTLADVTAVLDKHYPVGTSQRDFAEEHIAEVGGDARNVARIVAMGSSQEFRDDFHAAMFGHRS